jgi:hypothetical protein
VNEQVREVDTVRGARSRSIALNVKECKSVWRKSSADPLDRDDDRTWKFN